MSQDFKNRIERITASGTLTDRVFQSLIQLIDEHDLEPGSKLPPEMTMANRFGVSRTVIREAISRLKSEGRVESRQGSGVFVIEKSSRTPFRLNSDMPGSMQSILQVIELRQALEGESAALAAVRGTDSQIAAMETALLNIEKDVSLGGDGVSADLEFHHTIAEASGNPHFLALNEFLTKNLQAATKALRSFEATRPLLVEEVKSEHHAILRALQSRDPEAARNAARNHMEGAMRRMHSARQPNASDDPKRKASPGKRKGVSK